MNKMSKMQLKERLELIKRKHIQHQEKNISKSNKYWHKKVNEFLGDSGYHSPFENLATIESDLSYEERT